MIGIYLRERDLFEIIKSKFNFELSKKKLNHHIESTGIMNFQIKLSLLSQWNLPWVFDYFEAEVFERFSLPLVFALAKNWCSNSSALKTMHGNVNKQKWFLFNSTRNREQSCYFSVSQLRLLLLKTLYYLLWPLSRKRDLINFKMFTLKLLFKAQMWEGW